MRSESPRLIDVDSSTFDSLPCCGIKDRSHPGRLEKYCWLCDNAKSGLRAKAIPGPGGKPGAYIEYIPGEFAWRGVNARGYLFIHCIWIQTSVQRQGWGSLMVQACLDDARKSKMSGVAVMVREGPWMADRRLFQANGFVPVDSAPPDYELLAHKFNHRAASPTFQGDWDRKLARYGQGLTIIRSSQCPHIAKFAGDIAEAARKEYRIEPKLVELKSGHEAQQAPTPYAVFSLILDGRLLADHPISRTRFRNIMNKLPAAYKCW